MRLARRWGFRGADQLLDSLSPAEWDEWLAFDRIEPDTSERLHAQLTATGGAILYELQVIGWMLSRLLVSPEDAAQLAPPKVPRAEDLDPLVFRRKRGASRSQLVQPPPTEEFLSPKVAAALFAAAVGPSNVRHR